MNTEFRKNFSVQLALQLIQKKYSFVQEVNAVIIAPPLPWRKRLRKKWKKFIAPIHKTCRKVFPKKAKCNL